MPPVLGPRSSSSRRLWSCDEASGSTLRPSAITMKLASSPISCSSMTMRAPAARNASTTPAASGASGPTTVSAACSARASATSCLVSVIATLVSPASSAVPALPGATKTFPTRGERAIFQASACSRPPEPMTSTFTARVPLSLLAPLPSFQVYLAEEVQDAAVIDAAAESRNIAREQLRLLIAQREQRQHDRYRPAANDVGALNDRRREAKTAL